MRIRRSLEDVLLRHVEKVITRIAYAEYVRDVLRVVEHPRVRSAIDLKLGREYRRQIKPWLRRQVNAAAIDDRGARWWERVLTQSRINFTTVAMGFRFSTGIAQTLGLAFSAGRIGAKYVGLGAKRHATHWASTTAFAMARSQELARRNESMNRDVSEAFDMMRGNPTKFNKARAWAFWHIGMIDRHMVAIPTWLGAHQKGIDEGMTDEQASTYADKIVRNSQGSGREKDLAAIQSPNHPAMRFFTMFYTPFNVMMNAQWDVGRAIKRKDWRKAAMISFWFLMVTPLADALLSGDWPGDDDDEDWLSDLPDWFFRNIFFNLFGGIPVVRDGANTAERKIRGEYAPGITNPVGQIFDAAWKTTDDAADVFTGDEASEKWLKNAIQTSGYFGNPLGTGQIATTSQFLWDVGRGELDPDGVPDWYTGLTKGKIADD